MAITENIRERILKLIQDGRSAAEAAATKMISGTKGMVPLSGNCAGWITSALNVIEIVCPSSGSPYVTRAKELAKLNPERRIYTYIQVYDLVALLERLLEDVDAGLLVSVENQVTAVNYDNFLDHAGAFLKAKHKNEAAVISGVVFEDTIRTICRANNIDEHGTKLDDLITGLVKKEILTGLKAKRARAAAGLRTSATHAQWDEIDISDVKPAIDLTRELLATHLEN